MSTRNILIFTVMLGAVFVGWSAANYFFAVPTGCRCFAKVGPSTVDDPLILDNSIDDANRITVEIGSAFSLSVGEKLRICYKDTPKSGNLHSCGFLMEADCKFEKTYRLQSIRDEKSDIHALINFEVSQGALGGEEIARLLLGPSPCPDRSPAKQSVLGLHMNRASNTCEFAMTEWKKGQKVSGQLQCDEPEFYFNVWSPFPQTVKLFYTRAYYFWHSRTK